MWRVSQMSSPGFICFCFNAGRGEFAESPRINSIKKIKMIIDTLYHIQSEMVMPDITCTTCPSLTILFDRPNGYWKYNLSSSNHWWSCQKSIFVFCSLLHTVCFDKYSISKSFRSANFIFHFRTSASELKPQSLMSSWFQFLNSKTIPSMSSTKKNAVSWWRTGVRVQPNRSEIALLW